MISALRRLLLNHRLRRLMRDIDKLEAAAKRRGDTRTIGQARRMRKLRIHQGLATAVGWRGAR